MTFLPNNDSSARALSVVRSYLSARPWLLDLAVLLFLTSLPFLKWGLAGVVDPLDMNFPPNPQASLLNIFKAWDFFGDKYGYFAFGAMSFGPVYLLPAFFQILGAAAAFNSHLTFIVLAFGCSVSMYSLARYGPTKSGRLGGVIAGLYYALGPYMAGEIWLGHWIPMFSYIGAPVVLLGISKMFEGGRWYNWSLVTALASALVLSRVRMLPYFLLTCALFALFLGLTKRRNVPSFLRGMALAIPLGVAVNLFFLMPTALYLGNASAPLISSYVAQVVQSFPSTFLAPVNIIGLVSYGIATSVWGQLYVSLLGEIALLAVPAICLLVVVKKRNRFDLFLLGFASLLITHMFLFVFEQGYREWYTSLSSILPSPFGLLAFQKDLSYVAWPASLCFALLLSSAASHFATGGRRRSLAKALPIVLTVLIISSPLLTRLQVDPLTPITIPDYYNQAADWVSQFGQGFKLALATCNGNPGYARYTWSPTGIPAADVIRQLMPVPVVQCQTPAAGSESPILQSVYSPSTSLEREKALELLGVRFLIHRYDDMQQLNDVGQIYQGSVLRPFGSLSIEEAPQYAPFLFATTSYYLVSGQSGFLADAAMIPSLNFSASAFVFVDGQQLGAFDSYDYPRLIVHANASQFGSYDTSGDQNRTVAFLLGSQLFYEDPGLPDNYDLVGFNSLGMQILPRTHLSDPRLGLVLNSSSILSTGTSSHNDSLTIQDQPLYGFQATLNATSDSGFHGMYLYFNQSLLSLSSLNVTGGGLALQVYGDGSGSEFRASLETNDPSDRYQWPLQTIYMNWTGWRTIVLPFSDLQKVGSPTLDTVTKIVLWRNVSNDAQSSLVARGLVPFLGPMNVLALPQSVSAASFFSGGIVSISNNASLATKMTINVTNDSPALLLLNTGYDGGWEAASSGRPLSHMVANGFSNAFLVDTNGTHEVTVSFVPQTYYQAGLDISSLTIVTTIAFLVLWRLGFLRRRSRGS